MAAAAACRHLLVKVIDRILYKLDEMVRPFVHKILVVIEPLLIDEDYYARSAGLPCCGMWCLLHVAGSLISTPYHLWPRFFGWHRMVLAQQGTGLPA